MCVVHVYVTVDWGPQGCWPLELPPLASPGPCMEPGTATAALDHSGTAEPEYLGAALTPHLVH